METIRLHNSTLEVSRLCMGGCPLGGYGWGKVSYEDSIMSIYQAVEMGINFFDTADIYGLGHSERVLGQAIRTQRHNVVIASKFGVRQFEGKTFYDNSPAWIEEALEGSLKRLGTDYIDLYQIHYRDGKTPLDAVVDTLRRLQKKGLIRYCGLSNVFRKDLAELSTYKDFFVSFQDEFSLANRDNEEDIKLISSRDGFTPMTWGSLGQGVLTGKYNKDSHFGSDDRRSREIYRNFHGQKLLQNLKIVETMQEIGKDYGKKPPAIAIRFILDYLQSSVVLVGIKNTSQLKANLEALDWKLRPEHLDLLLNISAPELEVLDLKMKMA